MAKKKPPVKKRRAGESSEPASDRGSPPGVLEFIALDSLLLDNQNARLGAEAGATSDQTTILDKIVDTFGIDDVLSSIAVNGYFDAEPMVGVREGSSDEIRIAEGNRRLAACLILSDDPRAKNHEKRRAKARELQLAHGTKDLSRVPVRILNDDDHLLRYLGVRHIAAAQPWDSYAKAAWVAKIMDSSGLSVEVVSEMIGDQHRTVARILEGFHFVNQLILKAQFNPRDSMRPGRGSNPEFPFSWVYTGLGYAPIRDWLELQPNSDDAKGKEPLAEEKLEDGGEFISMLFGNKTKSRNPAVNDSRQIGDLARAIANPKSRQLLKRGKTVDDVATLLKPAKTQISDFLLDAREALNSAMQPISEGDIDAEDASELMPSTTAVKKLATAVDRSIKSIMIDSDD